MRLETERLLIREWQLETDAVEAIAIYGDPAVTQWIGDKSIDATVEAVRARLQRYRDRAESQPGLGCWAVVVQESETAIGSLLLMPLPGLDNQPSGKIEIGWHFCPASWGYGYATEAANAILHYGFQTLELPSIYAVTVLENDRSMRVTRRLGMIDLGVSHDFYGGHPLRLFSHSRAQWLATDRQPSVHRSLD